MLLISGGSRISHGRGRGLVGGTDSQGGYISKSLYVKTKESRPLGGHSLRTPPRSANANAASAMERWLGQQAV